MREEENTILQGNRRCRFAAAVEEEEHHIEGHTEEEGIEGIPVEDSPVDNLAAGTLVEGNHLLDIPLEDNLHT